MGLIVEKMKTAIETPGHGGRSIVLAMRPSPGDITRRLAESVGTPNDMCHHDTCYTSHDVAWAEHAHAADIAGGWSTYADGSDYSLNASAGTITRGAGGAIPAGGTAYVVYKGTDAKRYTDWVEFSTDTRQLSCAIDTGAMTPRVLSKMTKASGRNWTHDIARSTYIISFGWDMPGKGKNMMAQDYVHAISNGAKAVVFDPRLSPTANLAKQNGGEWISIKPGSDLAVQFAMMKVIVGNGVHVDDSGTGIWNKNYIAGGVEAANFTLFVNHIKGNAFATVPGGNGTGDADDIAAVLAWAHGKSGVPAAKIEAIARAFANNGDYTGWRPYIPTHKRDAGGPNYRNSFQGAQSTVLLNTLAGAIDRLGGSIKQRQFGVKNLGWVCPKPADFKLATYERIDHLQKFPQQSVMNKGSYQYIADSILDGTPYPIDVVMFRKYNVLGLPNPPKWVEALKRVFVIAIEIQMSETAQMADVVLPEVFFLEGRGWAQATYFALWPQIMLTGGDAPKLYPHTNDATVSGSGPKGWRDILLQAFPKAFQDDDPDWVHPETGYRPADLFRHNPGGTYDPSKPFVWATGTGASVAYDNEVFKQLDGKTWAQFKAANPTGMWPDPVGSNYNMVGGTFPVPASGPGGVTPFTPKYGTAAAKIQMYSESLAAYGFDPLPVWKERRQEKSGDFDLYMVVNHPAPHIHSTTQDLDASSECYGESTLWMNPATALAKGIKHGDTVLVQARAVADKGSGNSVKLRVFATERIKPDVVCFPHGWGHWSRDFADYAKTGACDGDMIANIPIGEILADNTPHPAAHMTDVVLKVTKV
jgi:thiosulfate reductase/polysulfide reductase chain A